MSNFFTFLIVIALVQIGCDSNRNEDASPKALESQKALVPIKRIYLSKDKCMDVAELASEDSIAKYVKQLESTKFNLKSEKDVTHFSCLRYEEIKTKFLKNLKQGDLGDFFQQLRKSKENFTNNPNLSFALDQITYELSMFVLDDLFVYCDSYNLKSMTLKISNDASYEDKWNVRKQKIPAWEKHKASRIEFFSKAYESLEGAVSVALSGKDKKAIEEAVDKLQKSLNVAFSNNFVGIEDMRSSRNELLKLNPSSSKEIVMQSKQKALDILDIIDLKGFNKGVLTDEVPFMRTLRYLQFEIARPLSRGSLSQASAEKYVNTDMPNVITYSQFTNICIGEEGKRVNNYNAE